MPPLETPSLPAQAEVVVIGGGVMGVATTYWLARFGRSVLLVESLRLGWGASGRNAGFMLGGGSQLEDPESIRAVLKDEAIEADYNEPGHLALASSPHIVEKIAQEVARRPPTAAALHLLDRRQCEDLLGMRISGRFLGGRWLPSGATIHPARFVYGLANAAIRRGAMVASNTPAVRVACAKGKADTVEVDTLRGRVLARHAVVACNVKTGSLLAGLHKVITPARGQVLCSQPLRPVFRVGLAVDWGTVYWRQTDEGVIVLGGYGNRDPVVKTSESEALDPRIQSALSRFLPEAFPGFPRFNVSKRWAGVMDQTADGKPIVGPWPDGRNIWVLAGFGGHGLPPALGVGRALAESIVSRDHCSMLEPFDPARFKRHFRS